LSLWARFAPPWAPCDQVAGSGAPTRACMEPRAAPPVVTAANKLSTATIAMANCHRRVLSAPRNSTMRRRYNTTSSGRWKRAVKSNRVTCVLPSIGNQGEGGCQRFGGRVAQRLHLRTPKERCTSEKVGRQSRSWVRVRLSGRSLVGRRHDG